MRFACAAPGDLGDCDLLLGISWLLDSLALRCKFRLRGVVILRIITADLCLNLLIDAASAWIRVGSLAGSHGLCH